VSDTGALAEQLTACGSALDVRTGFAVGRMADEVEAVYRRLLR
jgi:hypothetical protein